jgi:GNAT superfamily N-acetyltransferase
VRIAGVTEPEVDRTVVVDAAHDGELAAVLGEELQQEYVVRYGGTDRTPVAPGEFAPPDGAFLVALVAGEPAGSAALRRHDDRTAELKRMFVRARYRRTGVGRRLLAACEERALALGYRRLVLETGTKQPEALSLYTAAGYVPHPDFGYHRNSPTVRSLAKELAT